MFLQNMEPLPSFFAARSRLLREETQKSLQTVATAITANTALHTTANKPDNNPGPYIDQRADSLDRGRGRGGHYRGGRGRGRHAYGRG